MGLYQGIEGAVHHQRGMLYQKSSKAGLPQYLVVVDRVS
jgi:hypothetical protein